MALTVRRPNLNWRERAYLPAIAAGLLITLKHFKDMLLGRTKVTMQYPEEKWDSHMPDHYRGAPALLRDESFTLVLADNSYGRLERGSQLALDDAGLSVRAATRLDGGEEAEVRFRLDHDDARSPLGRVVEETGALVKARLARGDYLLFEPLPGYAVRQCAASEQELSAERLRAPRRQGSGG